MSNIQEQINVLIEIQEVEMDLFKVERQIQALNSEAATLDKAAIEYEGRVAQGKSELEALRRNYRELESESKINADIIVKSNEKLRGVKTNKEYQATLKEIEEIRKKNSVIEDRMLQFLEEIESAETAIADSEKELADFLDAGREKKAVLVQKADQECLNIETLNEKKSSIAAKAEPEIIAVLESVRKKVRGPAVVAAQDSICTGCHMNIPPQLFNELQRFDQVRYCPHCHRIIYWKKK
jgi:hypothetical protein